MLVNVGHENTVNSDKVVAIGGPNGAPIRRLISEAKSNGLLLDFCAGKACRSVIFTERGQVVLSSLRPRALRERLNGAATSIAAFRNGGMMGSGYEPE